MRNKLILTGLVILLVSVAAGCGSNSNDPAPGINEPAVEAVPPPQEELIDEPETLEELDNYAYQAIPTLVANITITNVEVGEIATLAQVNEIDFLTARIYAQSGGEYVDEMEEAFSWMRERDGGIIIATDEPLRDFEVLWIFVEDEEVDGEFYSVYHVIGTYVSVDELMPDAPLFLRWFITTGGIFPCTGIAFTDSNGHRHMLALDENRMDGNPPFFLAPFEDGVPMR